MSNGIAPSQSQSQSQTTSVVVNVERTSDPALERRIFSEVASAGRQFGRIFDVLDVLITAYECNASGTQEPSAADAISAFRAMREQIEKEKKDRSPERIIEALETMRREDQDTYLAVTSRLRQWLDAQAAESGGTAT